MTKVEGIRGPNLELKEKYMKILSNYSRDLESVRKLYQKQKAEPVVPRNMPPVAGKIAWSRQLYRRIEAPMKIFKKKPEIMKVSIFRILKIENLFLIGCLSVVSLRKPRRSFAITTRWPQC